MMLTMMETQATAQKLVVHYYRYGQDYQDWNIWGWVPSRTGESYSISGDSDFGKTFEIDLPDSAESFGLLIRKGNWESKDVSHDRYITVNKGVTEIYVIEGDDQIYLNKEQADRHSKILGAFQDTPDSIWVNLTNPLTLSGQGTQGFTLYGEDTKAIPIRAVVNADGQEGPCNTSFLKLILAQPLDVGKRYILTHPAYRSLDVVKRNVLDRYFYPGDDLGPRTTEECTSFRVWSPTASAAKVLLYTDPDSPPSIVPMHRDSNGTWWTVVNGNLEHQRYRYRLSINGQDHDTVDPYARCLTRNGKFGLLVNLTNTNPPGWSEDHKPRMVQPTDAIIYEMHVRDFSMSPNSGMEHQGKYLAFTEENTMGPNNVKTGLAHLKELGITHLHLMPTQDFASVDEGGQGYNWGYDPFHYFAPEGSYATDPDGPQRISEFKQMIQSLHRAGIRVIMDVVYNHTYSTGNSPFDQVAPSYFYRHYPNGKLSNGSGCGNEVASERTMVRKFILDSLKYWATEYHVDGFRFDLMGLLDKETMQQVDEELHKIDPTLLIYGEPWCGGDSMLPYDQQTTKGAQRNLRYAVFNDHFRNALKGDPDGSERGFVHGSSNREAAIRLGVCGAIEDFANHPCEVVNYASCHDNLTLWDKTSYVNPQDSESDRIKMDILAQAVILTSQGIPFIHGGEEFLRTKYGNPNTYNAGDEINQIDWERKTQYSHVFEYIQGLIKLRKEHPAFRMTRAEQIYRNLSFLPSPKGTVVFLLQPHANGDDWRTILVAYNQTRHYHPLTLPATGKWVMVVNDRLAGCRPLDFIQNELRLAPLSIAVLFQ